MKKVKFAAQVIILAAAFPVLFIAGIYGPKTKAVKPATKQEEPACIHKTTVGNAVSICPYSPCPLKTS
ncbi:MAG: hypothetical protein JST81_00845 [Bacteroidetes bacterium]|jgi:hypothetical protein|nr:hypothetical protein [Bacteroidota bacterium]